MSRLVAASSTRPSWLIFLSVRKLKALIADTLAITAITVIAIIMGVQGGHPEATNQSSLFL